jgi:DNA end-binding protein Ku
MARAIWKGVIVAGSVEVPVKLYSAVEDRSIHFRLLHEKDLVPVRQHMVHPATEDVVEREEMVRGHEVEPGVFVVLDEDELKEAEPEDSREIEALRFVPDSSIDGLWYDRPYWLGADGDAAGYAALRDALAAEEHIGLMRWVMRKREYIGVLRIHADRLMLATLRHAGEVVEAQELPAPSGRKLSDGEVRMAEKLVESLAGHFDPAEFRDEYRDRVLELVAKKAKGEKIAVKRVRKKKEEGSLADILKRSIEAGKEKAVA